MGFFQRHYLILKRGHLPHAWLTGWIIFLLFAYSAFYCLSTLSRYKSISNLGCINEHQLYTWSWSMSAFVGIAGQLLPRQPTDCSGGVESQSELRLEWYVCCAAFAWEHLRWLIYFRVSLSLGNLAVVIGICRVYRRAHGRWVVGSLVQWIFSRAEWNYWSPAKHNRNTKKDMNVVIYFCEVS